MNIKNLDPEEIKKFNDIAEKWWDLEGDFKPLHQINPLRLNFIKERTSLKGKKVLDIGCGGDRDKGKRFSMGKVASKFADYIVVTSDNPRKEDPIEIIKDIEKGLNLDSRIVVEPERSLAIQLAIAKAKKNDVVLIAGKGHEDYQILKDQTISFDDREQARQALSLK